MKNQLVYTKYKLLEKLLWDGSILLPLATEDNLNRIAAQVNEYNDHPIYAIAKEVMFLGETAEEEYQNSSKLFNDYYGTKKLDLESYFLGFSTPLQILTKLYTIDQKEIASFIKPANVISLKNDKIWALNGYILETYQSFKSTLNPQNNKVNPNEAIKIFDYTESTPFIDNNFFQLGITASKTVFRDFTTQITFSKSSPT